MTNARRGPARGCTNNSAGLPHHDTPTPAPPYKGERGTRWLLRPSPLASKAEAWRQFPLPLVGRGQRWGYFDGWSGFFNAQPPLEPAGGGRRLQQ